ncbi:hypothetical protein B0T25DRAFT_565541 [Lasiosphaeria hispida]|uniref:Uncharacterized protein n=1 Tax=Lasiosphaeria hispida TaxID=260671 RepID=A0AAJ0HT27_9PEZI|nr:hypothetical protein B0T25DRAFT_565541 [Lasiosphaeria hispida]
MPFVAWVEAFVRLTQGYDFGPMLSAQVTLLGWPALSQPRARGRSRVDDAFFTGPYESVLNSPRFRSPHNIMRYLLLHRIGCYLNMASEENGRRYQILRAVMDGAAMTLGLSHPFSLQMRAEFSVKEIARGEPKEAEVLLWQVYKAQSQNAGDKVRLQESIAFQEKASMGLLHTIGPTSKKYLRSRLFLTWAVKANGQLDTALDIYNNIWEVWAPEHAREEGGLAMCARTGMATVKGKQKEYTKAIQYGAQVLNSLKRIVGGANFITVDAALNMTILCIGNHRHAEARKHLSPVLALDEINRLGTTAEQDPDDNDSGKLWYHRSCLAKCLQASLHIRCGETDQGIAALRRLLHGAGGEMRRGSRELLRARLLLADCLVLPLENNGIAVDGGDGGEQNGLASGELFILEAVEKATRQIIKNKNDMAEAHRWLMGNGLRWERNEDYWMLPARPFAEAEWW